MVAAALATAFALAASAPRPEISFWSGFAHPQVYVVAADGSRPRRLTNLYSAKRGVWSPDGKRLAFDGRFHATLFDFDIGIVRADGSGVRRVTRGPERDIMASWSPGGRWLAFSPSRAEGSEPDVWLVRPSGKDAHRLARAQDPVHARSRERARRVRDEQRRLRQAAADPRRRRLGDVVAPATAVAGALSAGRGTCPPWPRPGARHRRRGRARV
jgi:dipeptidyl aminopeptidase/acylaminoacyl peptidase